MDWVEGTDLAALLRDRGRPGLAPSSVLAYLAQAAEALTHLHSQSPPVIHGDVKPGNLILTKGGRIKLVDFGLSSAPSVPRVRAGTPGYRAPELAAGGTPSRASDVYALAATAFALLTGSAPAGVLPAWEGFDPAQAEQLEAAIRLGMATDPAPPSEDAGGAGRAPAGRLVGGAADRRGDVLLLGHRGLERVVGVRSGGDGRGARSPRRADRRRGRGRGGSLIKSMGEGDSTVSVFDSAPAAVEAALAANRSLAAEEWPPGIRIAVRWGIHTGEAERRDADYYGPSVNLAARVRAAADGDEILLSSVTSELVAAHLPEGCSLVDLGPHRLTGVGHAGADPRARGSGPPHAAARHRLPLPRPARVRAGRPRLLLRPRGGRRRADRARVRRRGCSPWSARRAAASPRSCAPDCWRPRAPGEIAGIGDAVLLTPGAEARLDVPDEPSRLVVVDQFEELFALCDDADLRERVRRRAAGRCAAPSRSACAPTSTAGSAVMPSWRARSPPTRCCSAAMTADELARAVTEPARLAGLQARARARRADPARRRRRARRAAAALARAARHLGAARRAHAHRRRLPRSGGVASAIARTRRRGGRRTAGRRSRSPAACSCA